MQVNMFSSSQTTVISMTIEYLKKHSIIPIKCSFRARRFSKDRAQPVILCRRTVKHCGLGCFLCIQARCAAHHGCAAVQSTVPGEISADTEITQQDGRMHGLAGEIQSEDLEGTQAQPEEVGI